MTPAQRERVLRFARAQQLKGNVLGFSIDEARDEIELIVPLDADPRTFPQRIESVRVNLVWLPRPQELLA